MINNNFKRCLPRLLLTIGAIPTSYLVSMTYEEQLLWLCNFLENTLIPKINDNTEAINLLNKALEELREYVNDYFDNLDIQQEIDNKIQQMIDSGTFEEIILEFLNINSILGYNSVGDMKVADNLINGNICKTLGKNNYLDGFGEFYKIRTKLSTDEPDEINLIELTSYSDLIAEKIPNTTISLIQTQISELSNIIDGVETNIDEIETNIGEIENNITKFNKEIKNSHRPILIAHRGANKEAPENTIPAFQIAKSQYFDCCECDVHFTSDGHPVVMHDATVDYMTNGSGNISDMTLSQFTNLLIDNGAYHTDYPNLHPCSFEQYLETVITSYFIPVIELKFDYNENNCDIILDYLKKFNLLDKAIIISFNKNLLEYIRTKNKDIKILWLTNFIQDNIDYCKSKNFGINSQLYGDGTGNNSNTINLIKYAHDNNVEVGFWNILNNGDYGVACYIGADYITTDSANWIGFFDEVTPIMWTPYATNPLGYKTYSKYDDNQVKKGGWTTCTRNLIPSLNISDIFYKTLDTRALRHQLIRLKEDSVLTSLIDSNYRISIVCFDQNFNQLADIGWITTPTKTGFPNGTKFGMVYGSKTNNTPLTEKDFIKLEQLILNLQY